MEGASPSDLKEVQKPTGKVLPASRVGRERQAHGSREAIVWAKR